MISASQSRLGSADPISRISSGQGLVRRATRIYNQPRRIGVVATRETGLLDLPLQALVKLSAAILRPAALAPFRLATSTRSSAAVSTLYS